MEGLSITTTKILNLELRRRLARKSTHVQHLDLLVLDTPLSLGTWGGSHVLFIFFIAIAGRGVNGLFVFGAGAGRSFGRRGRFGGSIEAAVCPGVGSSVAGFLPNLLVVLAVRLQVSIILTICIAIRESDPIWPLLI